MPEQDMNTGKENTTGAEEEKKGFTAKDFFEILLYIGLVVLISVLIVTFIGQRTIVDGSSMNPTLQNGDNLIVDKLSYRFGKPQRFDIIVFPYKYKENTNYIKRIIGLPGETVQIDFDGNIYIDGQVLEEDYGLETILNPGNAVEPITLGDDEYFVMGDNRNNSEDSRFSDVGPIKRSDIIGKAWVRIYPFNRIHTLGHGYHGE